MLLVPDEDLDLFIKLELPPPLSSDLEGQGNADVDFEHARLFLTSPALHITAELAYLDTPSTSTLSLSSPLTFPSIPESSATPRAGQLSVSATPLSGLGVRTSGFPYTPAPWPARPQDEDTTYDSYASGPIIATQTWNDASDGLMWIGMLSGRPFAIWHLARNHVGKC